ncbi:MAG: peptide deformylase [Patescibacteria group bacterium]
MKILTFPDKFLRKTVAAVTVFDDKLASFANELSEAMIKFDGVGLAATQVGVDKRVIAINIDKENNPDKLPMPMVLVNPDILQASGNWVEMDEACLSVPGKVGTVKRPREVIVVAKNVDGTDLHIDAAGWLARVLQHEIDHLNGILFIDRITDKKKLKEYKPDDK